MSLPTIKIAESLFENALVLRRMEEEVPGTGYEMLRSHEGGIPTAIFRKLKECLDEPGRELEIEQ